ncbi:MAG: DUF2065 domain-containing protein [Pseudomonadota bacterium]
MIATIVLAIGLVCVIEGLVFALAPSRLEDIVRLIAEIPHETRRTLGLGVLALGVILIWIARSLGAG